VVRDSDSSTWRTPESGWSTKKAGKAYGRSILVAGGRTGILSTAFVGKAVGLVGSMGPLRGSMRVRVDGGNWTTVSLWSAKAGHRRVFWGARLGGGSHLLEIQGVAGQSSVDALLIIR
jgi:hypothetical protein